MERAVASSLDPAQDLELCAQTTHTTDVPAITIEADEAHHHPALSKRLCRSAFPHDRHRYGRFLMQNGRPNVQGRVQPNDASWPIAPIQPKTLKPTFAKAGRGSPTAKMAEADSRSAHLARL